MSLPLDGEVTTEVRDGRIVVEGYASGAAPVQYGTTTWTGPDGTVTEIDWSWDGALAVQAVRVVQPPSSGQITYITSAQVTVDWTLGESGLTIQNVDVQLAAV